MAGTITFGEVALVYGTQRSIHDSSLLSGGRAAPSSGVFTKTELSRLTT
jgi:hypothetical protein